MKRDQIRSAERELDLQKRGFYVDPATVAALPDVAYLKKECERVEVHLGRCCPLPLFLRFVHLPLKKAVPPLYMVAGLCGAQYCSDPGSAHSIRPRLVIAILAAPNCAQNHDGVASLPARGCTAACAWAVLDRDSGCPASAPQQVLQRLPAERKAQQQNHAVVDARLKAESAFWLRRGVALRHMSDTFIVHWCAVVHCCGLLHESQTSPGPVQQRGPCIWHSVLRPGARTTAARVDISAWLADCC